MYITTVAKLAVAANMAFKNAACHDFVEAS